MYLCVFLIKRFPHTRCFSCELGNLLINNWLSYFAALKDYKQSPFKYTGKPNLVTYKKQDKMTATFTNINCKSHTNKNGKSYLTFPKTKQTLNLGNLDFSDKKLIEVSIKPFASSFEITILQKF